MTLDEATIAKPLVDNPVAPPDNHVNQVLVEVLACFVTWLDDTQNEQKNHQILLALGKESLKRAKVNGKTGRFDKKDIAAAAHAGAEVDPQNWVRWSDMKNYWDARRDNYIAFARQNGIEWVPVLCRNATSGRNPTEYWLDIESIEVTEDSQTESAEATSDAERPAASTRMIRYEVTQPGEVKCSVWLKPWLTSGSFHFKGWRRLSVIAWLLLHGTVIALAAIYTYALAVKPELITLRTSATSLLLAFLAYMTWRFFIRPVVHLLDDRILHVDSWIVAFKEDAAQLEVVKIDKAKTIRLVRYTAVCPICSASVSLNNGGAEFPRRLVGQCAESPREHLFSFDRVTRKGMLLR